MAKPKLPAPPPNRDPKRAAAPTAREPEVLPRLPGAGGRRSQAPRARKGAKSKPGASAKARSASASVAYDDLGQGDADDALTDDSLAKGSAGADGADAETGADWELEPELDPENEPETAIATTGENVESALTVAGRAISPSDPLRRYLDEVRHYPLLSPEEEIRLATKLHETGDIEAARRLVQANLRLVVKIAFEYKSVYANVMDLIQEGNIGLMKAVSKYDPAKGARVGYYSSWWIRSYILKYLLDNFRLVKVGTTAAQKKLFFHLMREKERLEAQGVAPAPKLIADRLHVREKDVVEMEKRLGATGSEVSIDAPASPHAERSATLGESLEDAREGVDEELAREQLLNLIRRRLPEFERTLNERERRLLKDRMLSEEPKTLQEVADHYGLTRERARQIEAGVLQKLRAFLRPGLE